MNKRGTGLFLTIIFAMTVFGQADLPDPKPTKAVEELINVFDRFPIVALGEIHWSLNQHGFIDALIKHPAFAKKVNDIVVEFGSAKYQPIMDRYIAGETVARTELQQVMRTSPDSPRVPAPSPFKGMMIQDVTDAYLYLGPKASLRYDSIPPEVQRDEAYQRELERRQQLSGMSPAPAPRRP